MNHKLIHELYNIGAIKVGEFVLKSGQPSKIYFDLRPIISYPTILRQVAEAIWQKIQFYQFDVICGVPYTAIPIATCIALLHNCPMVMVRKERKNYGTKKQIEGVYATHQICLVIDDVMTTSSSILETAKEIESSGLIVKDAVVLVDRSATKIDSEINLQSIFKLNDILSYLLESNFISEPEREVLSESHIAV
jgi:uridine monophosphate synthetase